MQEDDVARIDGETLASISSELVRLKAQHYGRGPEEAKAYLNDNFLFVVMRGGMTRVEETLIGAGKKELVREVRLNFQEEMRVAFQAVVESRTRRKVLAYESQILFDPQFGVEIFLLSETEEIPEAGAVSE